VTEREARLIVGEPLRAWRLWSLVPGCPKGPQTLHSCYYEVHWPAGRPMRAHCVEAIKRRGFSAWLDPHSAPAPIGVEEGVRRPVCGCGIYALKDPRVAVERWVSMIKRGRIVVLGEVALWGRVLKHEDGYRAEYAYPIGLCAKPVRVPEDDDEEIASFLVEMARRRYGVGLSVP